MNGQSSNADQLVAALIAFIEHAAAVWEAYQSSGPGQLESAQFDPVEAAWRRVDELSQDPVVRAEIAELSNTEPNG